MAQASTFSPRGIGVGVIRFRVRGRMSRAWHTLSYVRAAGAPGRR